MKHVPVAERSPPKKGQWRMEAFAVNLGTGPHADISNGMSIMDW
mgnify:CR=1 FL=1